MTKDDIKWERNFELPQLARRKRSAVKGQGLEIDPKGFMPDTPAVEKIDKKVLNARAELRKMLEHGIRRTRNSRYTKGSTIGFENIHAVTSGKKICKGIVTDEPSVIVHVSRKADLQALSKASVIPKKINGIQTDVQATGPIKAHVADTDYRPAICGCSMASELIKRGTAGCLVSVESSASPGKRVLCFLSANHVFAACNDAKLGSWILQRSAGDGGRNPTQCIAKLLTYAKLSFDLADKNTVDCALAETLPEVADGRIFEIGTINAEPKEPEVGMFVMKFGTTTGRTFGTIQDASNEYYIEYDQPKMRVARFHKIFKIAASGPRFSAPGDSGALIVEVETLRPIGILIAGDNFYSYGCRISTVLQKFNAKIENQI